MPASSSSSSDDDVPLIGNRKKDASSGTTPLSEPKVSQLQDPPANTSNGATANGNGYGNGNGNGNGNATQTGVSLGFAPKNGEEDVEMRGALIAANGVKRAVSPGASSSSDSDVPLSKRRRTSPKVAAAKSPAPKDESSDSDVPVAKKLAAVKTKIEKQQEQDSRDIISKEKQEKAAASASRPRKPAVKDEESSSSDDDVPLLTKKAATATKAKAAAKKADAATAEKKATATKKTATAAAAKKTTAAKAGAKTRVKKEESVSAKDESSEDTETVHWWENPAAVDDSIKWTTLEHNGVVFPPPYKPLPKDVKLIYDGKPVDLDIEAEEVATFFGSMLNSTQNVENPVFQKNFFNDFRAVLKRTGGARDAQGNKVDIKEFKKCDFTRIYEHFAAERVARNSRSSAEKKKEREEREAAEAPYKYWAAG
ncbi:DNA topoisomerase 1 [Ascosphaera pollenicola]|nr:DNA topoisomerase 1 [Ascosphaera pollenicola]